MTTSGEFVGFPKIARLSRECVVTEKIDGTNAQVHIARWYEPEIGMTHDWEKLPKSAFRVGEFVIAAGSRNHYITDADNFGFASWVKANADALCALGEGRHFGEWWGSGIQRRYGLAEKRFSLFNVARWHAVGAEPYAIVSADPRIAPKCSTEAPACCSVVPVVYRGPFFTDAVDVALDRLSRSGSVAAPGFMQPEGVIVFHTASGQMFKKTIENDDEPKSKGRAA